MVTIADISGDNAVHALTTDAQIMATAVYLGAVGGPARVGDASVGSARGASIESGRIFSLPPKFPGYRLAGIKAYVPTGTTLTITYDNE